MCARAPGRDVGTCHDPAPPNGREASFTDSQSRDLSKSQPRTGHTREPDRSGPARDRHTNLTNQPQNQPHPQTHAPDHTQTSGRTRATTHQSRVLPPETRSLSSASSRGSQPGCQIRSDKSSTQTHTTRATQIQCRKNGRESSPGPVTPRASPAPSPRGSASRYSSVSLATKYREQAEDIWR